MDTNEINEMYKKLQNVKIYKEEFSKLSDEQKDIYFIFLYSYSAIRAYLKEKDDEFILNYIKNYGFLLEKISLFEAYELMEKLQNRAELLNVLEFIPNSLTSGYKFKLYLTSLEDDQERMKFIDKLIELKRISDLTYQLNTLEDENKIKYLKYLSNYSQITVIKSLTNLELKKEYVLKPEYSGYRSELVASVDDEEFIIEIFDKINVKKFKLNLINRIENKELKDKLLKRLGYKSLNKLIDSFESEDDEMIEIDNDVDPKITIGVELETCHKDIEVLKVLKEIPYGFRIHKDGSVRSGFEVVSPILHYNQDDMSNLYHICNILKENSFYTDMSCGGHIHIGADYLETVDEYKMLLHLYCNFEDIIYLICNKANSYARPSINHYAKKTKNQYSKAASQGVFEEEYESTTDFRNKLISLNDSRYKGLNVQNLKPYLKNTIEFRMANGEINFEELRYNIKLYARLIQVSKELANNKNGLQIEYLKLLNSPMKEIDRLDIFLRLLFPNEQDREFYKNRYKKNLKSLRQIISSMITKVDYTEIVNPVTLELKK